MGKKLKRASAKAKVQESSSEFETASDSENIPEFKSPRRTDAAKDKRRHAEVEQHDVYDVRQNASGETMMYDPAAYAMLHDLTVEWPSLSFDWLRADYVPVSYPLEAYMAIGTQSTSGKANYLRTMKIENLHRTYEFDDEEDADNAWRKSEWVGDQLDEKSDDGDFDLDAELGLKEPAVENLGHLEIKSGSLNRIRASPHNALIAVWASSALHICESLSEKKYELREVFSMSGGRSDGWALHWSPLATSSQSLVAGNSDGTLMLFSDAAAKDSARKTKVAYSVEDLQFSPTEENVFIAGGSNGQLEVFDTRDALRAQISWNASPDAKSDVNAIAWNPVASSAQFVATGQDSGTLKVWDLRNLSSDPAGAVVKQITGYHTSPINAIQWCPGNESVCIACSDAEASIYDFSVERDFQEERKMNPGAKGQSSTWLEELQRRIPTEVLFEHGGLRYAKDIRFHPQIEGFIGVTHFDGYQLWRPINWKSLYSE